MSRNKFGYPPEPLSYYKDHERHDWYFKREDKYAKKGQSWDLFGAWGQQRLMVSYILGRGSLGVGVVRGVGKSGVSG